MITNNPETVAGVLIAGQLPSIFVGLFGGALIDRYSARTVSVACDAINAVVILLIPLVFSLGWLNMLLLALLVFLSQVIDAPGETAKQVLLTELIDEHYLPREQSNGQYALTATLADLLAPTIAGGLMAMIGAIGLLVVDSATFMLSLLLIFLFVRRPSSAVHHVRNSTSKRWCIIPLQDWLWLLNSPILGRLVIFDLLLNMVATAMVILVLPTLAQQLNFGVFWLGIWLSAFATGTTLTTLAYAFLKVKWSEIWILKCTPLGQALGLVITFISALWGASLGVVIGMLLYGLHLGVGSMVDATLLQRLVPCERRGTIFAAFSSLRYLGVPLGLWLAGSFLAAEQYWHLLFSCVLILLVSSGLWLGKPLETE